MRDDRTQLDMHTCIHYATQSRKRVFIERRSTIRRRELFRRLRVTRLLEIDNGADRFLLSARGRRHLVLPLQFHPPACHPFYIGPRSSLDNRGDRSDFNVRSLAKEISR